MGPDKDEQLERTKQALIDAQDAADKVKGFEMIRTALNMDPEGAYTRGSKS